MSTASSSPVSAPDAAAARAPDHVWHGLAAELTELAKLAKAAPTLGEFYAELLRRTVAALAAEGGAVWAPQPRGGMKQLSVVAPQQRPQTAEAARPTSSC